MSGEPFSIRIDESVPDCHREEREASIVVTGVHSALQNVHVTKSIGLPGVGSAERGGFEPLYHREAKPLENADLVYD